jgi:tight adherence protein C
MLIVFLLTGLALAGVAVSLAIRALAFGGIRRQQTFAQIAGYGFSVPVAAAEAPARRRGPRAVVDGVILVVGGIVVAHLGSKREQEIRAQLRAAGRYQTEVETFVGYRAGAAVAAPLLLLWLSAVSGSLGPRQVLIAGVAAVQAWFLPTFLLKRKGARRLHQIDLEMPELVDLLVTCVEAGVGLAAALQLVARRVEGPLAQELRITLREQSMGLTLEDSLENMLSRVDSAAVRAFVQAIIQGQSLGVSIGKILRDLAVDMRKRRRQMAEERAQKAPTKILFPLIFLILPALFIVVLGGPMLGLAQMFGSV